jgi:hypothetical protein
VEGIALHFVSIKLHHDYSFFLIEASKTVTQLRSSIMSSGIISSSENQYVVIFVDNTSVGLRVLQATGVRTSGGRFKCG